MAAQENVLGYIAQLTFFYEEGVLHIAGGMVSGKVHLGEDMEVVLHLRTIGKGEAHALKYLYYLVLDNRERMASAELNGVRSTGKIRINIIIRIAIGIANLFA